MKFTTLLPGWLALMRWVSDALFIFLNGAISGSSTGLAISGGTDLTLKLEKLFGASVEALTPDQRLAFYGVAWFVASAANGYKRFVVWHDSNDLPNPFVKAPVDASHQPPAV